MLLAERFRGYLPVVVDLETGGFDNNVNPVLELACQFVTLSEDRLTPTDVHLWRVEPFEESRVDPASISITGIDLDDPDRNAMDEHDALSAFFKLVRKEMKEQRCTRAIMVAHNASFDLGFVQRASERCNIKRSPFHPFSTIDTAGLAAVAYGHTVLGEACQRAGIEFDSSQAHSAAYDVACTTELFCRIVNGWPYAPAQPQTG